MRRVAALRLALLLALACGAPLRAQEGDARIEQALRDLRAGKEADANVALLMGAVEQSRDPAALAAQIGMALFRDSRVEAAQPFLEIARKRRPDDGAIALALGRAHAMQYHFDEAVAALTAAEKLLPSGLHPVLHDTLAKSLSGLNRHDEAVAREKRAIAEATAWDAAPPAGQPRLDVVDYELALVTILEVALRHDEASAQLDAMAARALAPAKRAAVEVARAKILDQRGDAAGAAKAFAAALAAAPDDVDANYECATFRVRRDGHAEAKPLLEKVVALDPSREGAWFNLARTRLRLGDQAGGAAAMARYRELHEQSIAADERLTAIRRALEAKRDG